MTTQLDRATNALFPSAGNRVGNIKFMRGTRTGVTAEELAEQLNRADAQVRAGGETAPVADIDNYNPSN
jgi:hypothetical protein